MEKAITNAVQNKAAPQQKTLQTYIKSMEGEIAKALPSVITPERFTRMVLSAISSNRDLANVEPKSFLGAMMQAAQLGLEPNTPLGHAYILPFKDHGTPKAQFQIGYRGMIDLAFRSGEVTTVDAQVVYENDDFSYELGLEPKLRHVPALKDRGAAIAVYAKFHTKSGGFGFQVMSVDDIRKHAAKYSKSYNSPYSPWTTNFEEMAKKTVMKKTLKYAPLKSDFARALSADETVKTQISADMYEVQDEADYTDVPFVDVDDSTGEVLEPDSLFEEGK